MFGKLHFTIWPFPQIWLSTLNEFKILFGNSSEHLFHPLLFWGQCAFIISFFDKRSRLFNPMDISQEHRISGACFLSGTLKLMHLEPILLKASLRAILHLLSTFTFWTCVEWNELLVEFLIVLNVDRWVIYAILLVFPDMLKWTLIILALTDMDHLIWWRLWDLGSEASSDSCGVHNAWIINTWWGVERHTVVSTYTCVIDHSSFTLLSLHILFLVKIISINGLFFLSLNCNKIYNQN